MNMQLVTKLLNIPQMCLTVSLKNTELRVTPALIQANILIYMWVLIPLGLKPLLRRLYCITNVFAVRMATQHLIWYLPIYRTQS